MTHNTSLKQDWSVFKNKQINHRQQSNDLNLVMNATSIFSEPGGASGKEFICQCRRCKRLGFNPYCYLGVGSGNPLQSSCWENSMDRGAWGLQSIGSQTVGHDRMNEHMYVFWQSLRFLLSWQLIWIYLFGFVLIIQSCPILCDPMDCSLPGSSVHKDSPGKNTGVGCHALLQGIFPAQGSNPCLLHCGQILYHLSQGYLLLGFMVIQNIATLSLSNFWTNRKVGKKDQQTRENYHLYYLNNYPWRRGLLSECKWHSWYSFQK